LQLANIEQEGLKLVESETERRKRTQREWYVKNKDSILDRRKAAKKLKEAQSEGDSKKAYYWRNAEKMREYGRQYYQKKKAKAKV
jgi:SUMO ligase MMS21 Smc5/6 complex component